MIDHDEGLKTMTVASQQHKQSAKLKEWQDKSPLLALRVALKLSQEKFAERIGLPNRQVLQRWESGIVFHADGGSKFGVFREYFVPTKWLRAMLRAGIDVDFKALHDWFESRPKLTL